MQLRDKDGLTEQEFLAAYRPGDYPRPSVASDMAVFTVTNSDAESYRRLPGKELRLLLIERGGHPFLGRWALPGGFVRPNETVGQAAARELLEETGVDQVYLEQLGVFSDPCRDPRAWVMSCAHLALIDARRVEVRAGDDARNAAWFRVLFQPEPPAENGLRRMRLGLCCGGISLTALLERRPAGRPADAEGWVILENSGLAFDHAKIIASAMDRLRDELETGAVAFHLLPDAFTLTELQQVYEVILGRPLLKAAFRRKIAPLVRETNRYTENAGHRPSRLYRRRQEEKP
ncbi:MAG TPA: NUDIX hydrolase [Candidatus Fimivivens faecavium]|nr:NUDIX hydrolase [Candidatus Fimivivens faecavium]